MAAMTLPTIVQKYRAHVVETRLAKFYSTINQAITRSEVDNGDKKYWSSEFNGWETDEDGNADKSKPAKSMGWYNKYLKDYLKTTKVEYEKTIEGKVKAYFPDGSLLLISSTSFIFYPEAKHYDIVEHGESATDRNRTVSGIKYFTFMFAPWAEGNIWSYSKGVEPYKSTRFDGTREMLLRDSELGCKENVSNERAYCTYLIQMNGWKVPKDYPFKF